jgi:inner membrane protein
MMTLSHLAISGLLTATILGSSSPIVIGVGAIAGLLPDVDIGKSPAGRILFPISRFLEKRFPHRSCTHSIVASLFIAAGVYGLAYAGILHIKLAHAILIGYTAGYLADLITKSGIQLFYPASLKCVVPGNRNLRLSTGSNWEYAILIFIIGLFVLTLNINTRGGMAFTFNEILATPRGVQELLTRKGGTHQIIALVEGVRTFDRSRVKESFVVLDQKDAGTFIVHPVDRASELYQVSNRPEGDRQIFSERITASIGHRIKTKVQFVRFEDEEIRLKLVAIDSAKRTLRERAEAADIYLTGSIAIEDADELKIEINPQHYPFMVKRGGKLELDRCPLEKLIDISNDQWGTGQLTVKTIYSFAR